MKLCPKLHANPRFAEACSHCGIRDLSVPQPKVPLDFRLAAWLIQGFSGFFLSLVSIRLAILLVGEFRSHSENYETLIVIVVLAVSWFLLALLPDCLRRTIHRTMKRWKGHQ